MRSKKEMFDLILNVAYRDERVRAVILDGSRADPEAPSDPFQDFDIIYAVTDVKSFKCTPEWINIFGERMILQLPDDMTDPLPVDKSSYAYLIQLADGNRIDLSLYPLDRLDQLSRDSIRKVLLDKDGIVDDNAISARNAYLPHPPTARQFHDCCNEFWWVCPYCAKGLWRGQIVYAKTMLDEYIREQMVKMLRWHIGMETDFSKAPGKYGKYFQKYLTPELWKMYLQTYSDAGYENTWQALFTMCKLFRTIAIPIAKRFGLDYPFDDDRRVSAYLQHIYTLPEDAKEIYPTAGK